MFIPWAEGSGPSNVVFRRGVLFLSQDLNLNQWIYGLPSRGLQLACLLNENLIAENKFRKNKLIRESDSHLASSARFHYKSLSLNDDTYGGGSTLGGAC